MLLARADEVIEELVANRFHLRNDGQVARAGIGHVVKSRATNPH
jgi:hypothetical protein